jgi:type II secretory ATPase GspE/PulE/Tfp pilus assembly ATPase PilB-like protein
VLTEPLIDWSDDWPLPSWLVKVAGDAGWHLLRLGLADGGAYTGILLRAQRQGDEVIIDWQGQSQPTVVPWRQVTSLTMVTLLEAAPPAAPAKAWDRQMAHERLPFSIEFAATHACADIAGHTLGYMWARHGLFLYIEQPDGRYQAHWYATCALGKVRIGKRKWQASNHGATTPKAPVAGDAVSAAASTPGAPASAAATGHAASDPVPKPEPTGAPPEMPASAPPPPAPEPATNITELAEAMRQLHAHPPPPLRRVLVDLGLVPESVIAERQLQPGRSGFLLGDLVAEGVITQEQSHRVLARLAGAAEVDLAHFQFEPLAGSLQVVDSSRYRVCALGAMGDIFYVATANPTSQELLQLLSSLLKRRVELVWAPAQQIDERIARLVQSIHDPAAVTDAMASPLQWSTEPASASQAAPAPRPVQEVAPGIPAGGDEELGVLLSRAIQEAKADPTGEHPSEVTESSDFVKLVKRIIQDALRMGASDIHIETNPGQAVTRVRFRRDGDLEHYLALPAALRAPLISRIKVMARLDISERRRPQDGKINFADFGGSKLELRVAVLPTHDGLEDVVMRLLATSDPIPLAKLGLQPRDEASVMAMAGRTFGLILAVGPTGSGKTTTLHSILKELNTAKRKVWTAEDPIEITQDGLRQVQVNPKIGVTFASAMRAFLRADPDVIMIGEIRDEETSKIAIEASLTGHLVLSTLHTNNASESVTRLLDMGMDPMTFGDSLIGIVAQRLVRALCAKCAAAAPLAEADFEALLAEYIKDSPVDVEEGRKRLLAAGNVGEASGLTVKTAVGCPHCAGKGYKGRIGVYEVLQNSLQLRTLIQRHARPHEIFESAVGEGMRSLRHDAIEKVLQGRIDMAQARLAYE